MLDRRAFLGTAAIFPFVRAAGAQSPTVRIAWLSPTKSSDGSVFLDELRAGLRELGYAQPRNLVVEPYWGEESLERTNELAADVIASRPNVIVAQGSAAVAFRQSAGGLPVVFGYSGDPVEAGLVESLARPGRMLTGVSFLTLELVGKRMELLKEVLPSARSVAVVTNPRHPGDNSERRASQAAAEMLGVRLAFFEAQSVPQQMEALAQIEAARTDAVMLFPVQNVIFNRTRIAEWSIRARIPTVSGWAQFAEGGNLMSYGPNLRSASRRLAAYVDRVLKGARPADLPVELPTVVEFVLNLKTARALGIEIPPSLLARADAVIE